MTLSTARILSILALLLGSQVSALQAQIQSELSVIQGRELLISVPTAANSASISAAHHTLVEKSLSEVGGDLAASSAGSVAAAVAACAQVEEAIPGSICEPNVVFHSTATPQDPYWAWMRNLRSIEAPRAWDTVTSSSGVLVAVVDTGVDYTHSDLTQNIAINQGEIADNGIDDDGNGYVDDRLGYDFADRDSDPRDLNGHGTHVAGTIGAHGNNGEGLVGVNWGASILAVRVLDEYGSGTLNQVIAGIDYAVARGARVINLSLGAPYGSRLLLLSLQRAQAAGVVIVAAAGNDALDNDSSPSFPANYQLDSLISVAATDRDDVLADFSNFGATSVHLAAPGVSILSTYLFGSYVFLSGTSMATPHVAGAAALVLGLNRDLTGVQVKDILMNTVDPVESLQGKVISGGRLNLGNAIAQALSGRAPSNDDDDSAAGLAVDVSVSYAKNGKRARVAASVYSLATGEGVDGAEATLVCGKRAVKGRTTTSTGGEATFKVKRLSRSVICAVKVQAQGVSSSSNPISLRSSVAPRNHTR